MTEEKQLQLDALNAEVQSTGARAKALVEEAERISAECKLLNSEAMTQQRPQKSKSWCDRVDVATERAKRYEAELKQVKKEMMNLRDRLTAEIGDDRHDDGLAESLAVLIDGMHRMSVKETK